MSNADEILAQAQAALEGTPRSKLENYCAAIFELRRKRWTYEKIADWLKTHGVEVVPSSVFRFCRTHRAATLLQPPEPSPLKIESPRSTATSTGELKPKRKYRFNLDA